MSDGIHTYRADILERMKDLGFLAELGPDTSFTYSWDHGYERVTTERDGGGTSNYQGSYHPDGYCWNGRDGDDHSGICVYCGCTLHG